ncbi:MAG: M23 family metallopeptidase [Clostridiales bacterium]|nr:M23 family metallopeptidase [Clostridiales bacterium]
MVVKVGDSVKAGDKIGKAGKSVAELNTGAHLHLELKKDGKYVDPTTVLPESEDK